jgi:hypothetical protein
MIVIVTAVTEVVWEWSLWTPMQETVTVTPLMS